MKNWIQEYLKDQVRITQALSHEYGTEIEAWVGLLKRVRKDGKQIFICGNGGSAANASHFAVDLGKGASGRVAGFHGVQHLSSNQRSKRFRIVSLNDNVPWLTALGNDCSYDDVFVEQLKNYGQKGDLLIGVSVSGNSPNVVKAVEWANDVGVITLGLVGNRPDNRIAKIATRVIVVNSGHYGRVEDAQMHVLHLLCYAFIEQQV